MLSRSGLRCRISALSQASSATASASAGSSTKAPAFSSSSRRSMLASRPGSAGPVTRWLIGPGPAAMADPATLAPLM